MSANASNEIETLPLVKYYRQCIEKFLWCKEEEAQHGSSSSALQSALSEFLSPSGALSLTRALKRINSECIFSANETIDDVQTGELRYAAVHYFLGVLVNMQQSEERRQQVRMVRIYLSLFIKRNQQWGLIDSAFLEQLEKAQAGMSASERRAYKVAQYQREKQIRAQLLLLAEKRRRRSDVDGEDDCGGFDDEEAYREFELLQLHSMVLDAAALLESAAAEDAMLAEMSKRREEMGDDAVRDELQRARVDLFGARSDNPNNAPVTIDRAKLDALAAAQRAAQQRSTAAQQQVAMMRKQAEQQQQQPSGGVSLRADMSMFERRENIARQVFQPSHTLATYTPEQAAFMDMQEGKFLSGGANDAEADESEDEDANIDDEAALRKVREWDNFKDENPKGQGNTSNRG